MSMPINPKDQGALKNLDQELNQYVKQCEKTGSFNEAGLAKIEQQIKALAQNKEIPDSVRQSLKNALQNLKGSIKGGDINLANVISAQNEISQYIEGPPTKPKDKQ